MLKFPGMFRPWDLDELTLEEYCWLLDFDPERPEPFAGRGLNQSDGEMLAGIREWARMTPRQKLEAMV